MFDKKYNDKMKYIINSNIEPKAKAYALFDLMDEASHTFIHKRWVEEVLYYEIKKLLEENKLSIGQMLREKGEI